MPKTADIIAQALKEQGVRHAFGIPGGEVLELLDAFRRAGIRFILTKQELGAGFMADAAFQLTGRPGVLVATLGPGITNTTTAVAQALLDRSAVIVITGEIATSLKAIYTHQIIDQAEMLRPLTKWSTTFASRGALAQARKGIAVALSPMPGPVHFNVPTDVAAVEQDAGGGRSDAAHVGSQAVAQDLGRAVKWLGTARSPLALVGVGVQLDGAARELRRFVEAWRVPVITTYKAKGVIPEDHPLCIGGAGLSPVVDAIHMARLREADLVLCVGFDPVELRSDWIAPWSGSKRTVSLDLVPNTHHVYRCAIECAASIKAALAQLASAAPARAPRRWTDAGLDRYRRTIREAIEHRPQRGVGPYQVVQTLREVFPRDTIATVDTGSHRILINHVWQSYEPRRLLQSNGLGSMGYALPAAVAAKLLFPKRPVLAMMGEAGLDMVIGEMALLDRHRLAPTIVVFRDDTLSLIKLKQERMKLPETGVATGSPDYAALAKAYGGQGVVVESAGELGKAARSALRSRRFTLIEARIDPAEYRKQM
ncbi:MAG: thiamine pyrophosphate-binding protein [Betaproteobacteria bacterium]|nr:thiamine pyrophosphate-binding protein [Betaproteobacteria bacterium]